MKIDTSCNDLAHAKRLTMTFPLIVLHICGRYRSNACKRIRLTARKWAASTISFGGASMVSISARGKETRSLEIVDLEEMEMRSI
jgi:hypothetical protein